jgi:hypothetical protein
MKIKIIKDHPKYSLGVHYVSEERGRYLIAMGIAVEKVEKEPEKEKVEFKPVKEKVERKTRKK